MTNRLTNRLTNRMTNEQNDQQTDDKLTKHPKQMFWLTLRGLFIPTFHHIYEVSWFWKVFPFKLWILELQLQYKTVRTSCLLGGLWGDQFSELLTDWQTKYRLTDRLMDRLTNKLTNRQNNRPTNRLKDRPTDTLIAWQTDPMKDSLFWLFYT